MMVSCHSLKMKATDTYAFDAENIVSLNAGVLGKGTNENRDVLS